MAPKARCDKGRGSGSSRAQRSGSTRRAGGVAAARIAKMADLGAKRSMTRAERQAAAEESEEDGEEEEGDSEEEEDDEFPALENELAQAVLSRRRSRARVGDADEEGAEEDGDGDDGEEAADSRLKVAPSLYEHTAPSPTPALLEAWAAPVHSGARPWQAVGPRSAPASPP